MEPSRSTSTLLVVLDGSPWALPIWRHEPPVRIMIPKSVGTISSPFRPNERLAKSLLWGRSTSSPKRVAPGARRSNCVELRIHSVPSASVMIASQRSGGTPSLWPSVVVLPPSNRHRLRPHPYQTTPSGLTSSPSERLFPPPALLPCSNRSPVPQRVP